MRLGFYYHVTCFSANNKVHLPSYLGVFVDELAKQTDLLYYFAYTTSTLEKEQNYTLKQKNIRLINLGQKKPFPVTVLQGYFLLSKFKSAASQCDSVLVRAPSPLAPYFYYRFKNLSRIHYLMVGDYMEGIKHQKFPISKQKLINLFTHINEYLQNQAILNSGCLVNSVPLLNKYSKINPKIRLVKTTTLTPESFYRREDTCTNPSDIKLLFVGRIEKAKGMDELTAVFRRLRENNYPVSLHLAGWDTKDAKSYFKLLEDNTVTAKVWKYYGFLSGAELFDLYRKCDIFILPSYHEGFPRVIWEAMANSLPVISTKVGSIPYFLDDRENVLLIELRDEKTLLDRILELIDNKKLRREIILNAFNRVNENTIDVQVRKILEIIRR